MTYRNDHDAALARADALEVENARLQREIDELRAPAMAQPQPEPEPASRPEPRKKGLAAAWVAALIAGGGLIATMPSRPTLTSRPEPFVTPTAEPSEQEDAATTQAGPSTETMSASRRALTVCVVDLVLDPADANAASTDPRRAHHSSIAPVLASTGCSAAMQFELAVGTLSEHERVALQILSAKEQRLEVAVKAIHDYYDYDPYRVDNYERAPGLWADYGHALIERNAALADWKTSF